MSGHPKLSAPKSASVARQHHSRGQRREASDEPCQSFVGANDSRTLAINLPLKSSFKRTLLSSPTRLLLGANTRVTAASRERAREEAREGRQVDESHRGEESPTTGLTAVTAFNVQANGGHLKCWHGAVAHSSPKVKGKYPTFTSSPKERPANGKEADEHAYDTGFAPQRPTTVRSRVLLPGPLPNDRIDTTTSLTASITSQPEPAHLARLTTHMYIQIYIH